MSPDGGVTRLKKTNFLCKFRFRFLLYYIKRGKEVFCYDSSTGVEFF